jgi:pilus assembly protein FimV
MIITCDACSTSFNLDDKMIKSSGSKVRCSVCANVFTVFPQQESTPEVVAAPVKTPTEVSKKKETDTATPAIREANSQTDGTATMPGEDLGDSGATVIADLDDEDFNLGLDPDDGDEDNKATMLADLDDDDLDLSLDLPSDSAATVITDLDQDDLDLDLPDGVGHGTDSNETVIADIDDDLDLDFSLDLDDGDQAQKFEKTSHNDDDSDLTLIVDDEIDGDREPVGELPELDDDLDLSSLEGLLKDDDSVNGSGDKTTDEDRDVALELDMDVTPPESSGDSDAMLENSLEELELDLEAGGSGESSGIGDGDDADIDLSEIEKMLEEPESANSGFSSVPEQDLDLDIEASLESERWMTDADESNQVIKDEELDLSELEQVLDDVGSDETDDVPENQELELDLGDDDLPAPPRESLPEEEDLAFELSDVQDDVSLKTESTPADRESLDMELEFEVETDSPPEPQQVAEETGPEVEIPVVPETDTPNEATLETGNTVRPAAVVHPKPAGKGMSRALIFILIVALLSGGVYGTYYLLNRYNVEIPFLSDYLKPKVDDPGNLKMSTTDINSRFVDNANVGKLFVITGKVKNGYAENRGMITLVGKIFSAGKILVHEEKVYGGNIMSDLELANLEWDAIKKRLSNRLGDNRSNVKIEPGNSIPFMVVFSGLPDDLEEFTIEVVESTTLK